MTKHNYIFTSYFPLWIGFFFRKWKRESLSVTSLYVWVLNIGFWEFAELYSENTIHARRGD